MSICDDGGMTESQPTAAEQEGKLQEIVAKTIALLNESGAAYVFINKDGNAALVETPVGDEWVRVELEAVSLDPERPSGWYIKETVRTPHP